MMESQQPHPMPRRSPSGFTLIELVVVIGVLMVVIGLALPSLTGVRKAADLTRHAIQLSQNGTLVAMFAGDHDETYPIGDENAYGAMTKWHLPLIESGVIDRVQEVDPDAPAGYDPNYGQSMALVYDPALMTRGRTRPMPIAYSSPIAMHAVTFPSDKGAMWTIRMGVETPSEFVISGPIERETFWCCVPPRPVGVVLMADNSAVQGRWTDFTTEDELYIENGIGNPVCTTWGGARGRDR